MKTRGIVRTLASLIVTAALLTGTTGAAGAVEERFESSGERAGSPDSSFGNSYLFIESTMELKGFDEAVAEANGYEILTDANGVQRSVPVSEQAIAFEISRTAELADASDGSSANRTTVTGNCGTSFVGVTRYGNRIMVGTGYAVFYPVVARLWVVQIYSFAGLPSFTWTGSSGASWNSAASFFMSAGGVASVTPGSSVVMTNGAVCWSGSPSEGF